MALGDLDKVARVVRLGGFVNATPDFLDGPKVLNGASDLMVAAFGDKGRHARTTVGVAALPRTPPSRLKAFSKSLDPDMSRAPAWLTARPIAHRGLHDRARGIIENMPSAIDAAVARNFAIEVDLQPSADGEAMVHHDYVLGRLTEGTGELLSLTSEQLKQVVFKNTSDRMMTLGDLCARVAGKVPLVLEIKSRFDGSRTLVKRMAEVLASYKGPVAAMSFDPDQVAAVRE
jgi:glycerophosphoryl diester phosphodiesterase